MVLFYIRKMKFKQAIPVTQIAAWTNSEIIGDSNAMVTGLNEIHNVEAGDITFVDHEKYYGFTLNSKASFVIINTREIDAYITKGNDKVLLYNSNPFEAKRSFDFCLSILIKPKVS